MDPPAYQGLRHNTLVKLQAWNPFSPYNLVHILRANLFFISSLLKLTIMVETDIAQLSGECGTWRETLRNYRDELGRCQHQLENAARNQVQQDTLKQVEHFHNQFQIQLTNIHDLKQSIKTHDRKVQIESSAGQVEEASYAEHERLHEEYERLNHSLQNLQDEFKGFVGQNPS
jgi:chromosome segregation ATPase